jgi:DNA (cytosine-5)-methyltransferase 1
MSKRRPVSIDLFSGAGGLALGFEQAGFDVLASVEYDPVHAAVHEYNFPLTQVVCADITKMSAERVLGAAQLGAQKHGVEWDGTVDVIFGGPPCQGFSLIGKRALDDPRNELVFHFFRLIAEIRPRYFVMENVPGMTRGGHSGILAQLIENFEAAGYDVTEPYRLLNAADYGVPQERKRLILMGALKGEKVPMYPDPTVTPRPKRAAVGSQLDLKVERNLPLGPSVWDAIGDLPDIDEFPELWDSDRIELSPERADEAIRLSSPYAKRMRSIVRDDDDYSHPRVYDSDLLTGSTRTEHRKNVIERFRNTEPGTTEQISRFYRPDANGLCNTLRAGSGSERGAHTSPRPIHPLRHRVISVREAARIHSFPDWFQFNTTKWHGFRQVGNAVAPLLGRAVAASIRDAMGVTPVKPRRKVRQGDPKLLSMTSHTASLHYGVDKGDIPAPRKRAVDAR